MAVLLWALLSCRADVLVRWCFYAGCASAQRYAGGQRPLDRCRGATGARCADLQCLLTFCNRDVLEELVQFFVISDRQLQVSRNDAGLLVVACCVASQLEALGSDVLHDRGHVDRRARADLGGE
jgi:hypothetical protein